MKSHSPLCFATRTYTKLLQAALPLAACATTAYAVDYTNPKDTLPDSGNFIDFAFGYADTDGNEAAFLSRHPYKSPTFGGIERFQYEGYAGKYTEFSVVGRAIAGNDDYMVGIRFDNEDVGFFHLDYQENRYWYDGSGLYFPGGETWIDLYDDEMAVDRTSFKLSAGLTFENFPDIEFSYKRLTREGLKGSTVRADTNLTGGFGTRNIVPAFLELDETRDIFEVKATETYGNTKASLKLHSETSEGDNARKMTRRPDETAFRRLTHREMWDNDLFSARATTITDFSEKTKLTTGVAYTEIDANITGSRIFGAEFDDPFDVDFRAQNRDHGYVDLITDSQIDQWVLNANLLTHPAKHVKAVYSLRYENMDTATHNEATETEFTTTGNRYNMEEVRLLGHSDWNDLAASAEVIYTGIENAVYSGSILYTDGDGNQMEEEFEVETGDQLLERLSNNERKVWKFALAGKFYPSDAIRIFTQYYHKKKENAYNHIIDPTEPDGGDRFPAFTDGQDFTTDDVNVSMHWKANRLLSGFTRIDFQKSTIDSRGQDLEWSHNYDREALIFSQALSLSLKHVFIQLSGVYADDSRESPVSEIGGNVGNTVRVLDGDFWNGNLSANFGIDDVSNMAISLFYNRVDTFQDNSEFGQPYGEDLEETGATVVYTRKLSDNVQMTVRYSYFDSEDKAHADFNDYVGQVIYSTLRYRF